MKVLIWLARFAIGVVLLIAGAFFGFSLCITYLKLTGQIVEGQRMYFELYTPTWGHLLEFQAFCVVVLAAAFFIRSRLPRARPVPPRTPRF